MKVMNCRNTYNYVHICEGDLEKCLTSTWHRITKKKSHKRDHTTAKPELYVKIVMKTFDYTHISTDDDDHEEGRGDQGRVPT